MKRFEFYKSIYDNIIKEKTELSNSLNIPIAVVTVLAAAIYNYIITFNYQIKNDYTVFFEGMLILTIILLLITVIFIILSYNGFYKSKYEYKYLPYCSEINTYHERLESYYSDTTENQQGLGLHELENWLINSYIECNDNNMHLNERKIFHFRWAKNFMIACLFSVGICLIPYLNNYLQSPEKIQKIEITNNNK
jgi:hypothetical protein